MIQEDEKYKAIKDTLRSLPRIKAKNDFEARLMQRIKHAESPVAHVTHKVKHEPVLKSWFQNLFRPAFVPAMGLTAVLLITVVVYFAYYSKLNDGSPEYIQQFVSSTNQGDLIIYVKKDADDLSGSYPKEYSAVDPEDTRSLDNVNSPVETSSDFFAKPDPSRIVSPDVKSDRVSEEQRIEMQRSVDYDKEKGVDVKGERKIEDGIMKKESKSDIKIESKGELKSESKDEKKNIYLDEENNVKQDEKVVPKKKQETIIKGNENEAIQKSDDETDNRVSRATKKDSTNNKSDSEAEEKETNKK